MENLYYNPKELGFELVDSHETQDEAYQFDIVLVLKRVRDGKHFWCHDAGCSCPTPFEGHSEASLETLTMENWAYFEDTVRGQCAGRTDPTWFLQRVQDSLGGYDSRVPLSAYRKH